jgi:hypothetical protein
VASSSGPACCRPEPRDSRLVLLQFSQYARSSGSRPSHPRLFRAPVGRRAPVSLRQAKKASTSSTSGVRAAAMAELAATLLRVAKRGPAYAHAHRKKPYPIENYTSPSLTI